MSITTQSYSLPGERNVLVVLTPTEFATDYTKKILETAGPNFRISTRAAKLPGLMEELPPDQTNGIIAASVRFGWIGMFRGHEIDIHPVPGQVEEFEWIDIMAELKGQGT